MKEDQFQVGDRVQGKLSGSYGVITEALGNDRYKGDIDDAPPGMTWTCVRGDNFRLIEAAQPAPAKAEFEAGDVVRHKGNTNGTEYDVKAVDDIHLWVAAKGTSAPGYVGIAAAYEKVLPFFEAGKAYRRQTEWSPIFQKGPAVEHFKVERVDHNQGGKPVAYGRLYLPGLETRHGWRWMTKNQYHFNNEAWEQL